MLARSPEPEAPDKVLDNNPDRIGICKRSFLRSGETGEPGEKPLGARERTNNKLNPHMMPGMESNPGHSGGSQTTKGSPFQF